MTSAAPPSVPNPSLTSRPKLSHLPSNTASPSTPQRATSSYFGSPSTSRNADEDSIIVALGSRHLSAGFAGEESPRCTLSFGPESERRAGDYRQYAPDYANRPRKRVKLDEWGDDHELWRMDLKELDVGLVGDRIERAMREAFTKYLLLDSKARKICLVLPSMLPHRLLDRVLRTLFEGFDVLAVTVLSEAIMATVAAGCRNGLVVDIGWRETVVTAVYEYREVKQWRSIRGAKLVGREMASMLQTVGKDQGRHTTAKEDDNGSVQVDVEQAEDVLARMGWCNPLPPSQRPSDSSLSTSPPPTTTTSPPTHTTNNSPPPQPTQKQQPPPSYPTIEIPSPFNPTTSLLIPSFIHFTRPIELALLAPSLPRSAHDDHDTPLPLLIFRALTSLAPDIRALCLSRIMFTGGLSQIPGLKPRLLNEVSLLIEQQGGFDPVFGVAAEKMRGRVKERKAASHAKPTDDVNGSADDGDDKGASRARANVDAKAKTGKEAKAIPPSQRPHTPNDIDARLAKQHLSNHPSPQPSAPDSNANATGQLRGLSTLGPWAGASLMASLRVKGVVDVDRESFLKFGLGGARTAEKVGEEGGKGGGEKGRGGGKTGGRKSVVDGLGGLGGKAERGGWTMGVWA